MESLIRFMVLQVLPENPIFWHVSLVLDHSNYMRIRVGNLLFKPVEVP